MEIERKFLVKDLPDRLAEYPFREIEQGYLNTDPVVRVRKDGDSYYLTYKGKGLLAREEYNLPLDQASYEHLIVKADGIVLTKRRYQIPFSQDREYTIELDIFHGIYDGLILAEVEFESEEEARNFTPPQWFGRDVTFSGEFQNSRLSQGKTQI